MPTISKQTATIITATLGVLFGCAGIFTCLGTLLTLPSFFNSFAFMDAPENIGWLFNILGGVCSAFAFVAVPIVFYVVLLRGRTNGERGSGSEEIPRTLPG